MIGIRRWAVKNGMCGSVYAGRRSMGATERTLQIFTDGASRGNPGPSCYAFIFVESGSIVRERAGFLGEATNNTAEYQAVIHALREAAGRGKARISVHSDSELVIRQLTGRYRIRKSHLAALHAEVVALIGRFQEVAFVSVPRDNPFIRHADTLCNRCLDESRGEEMRGKE
jgi:ribonuclease HI